MKTRMATAVSGCVALVLTLTACGDDQSEQTEAWAQEVCDEVRPQVERIQAANEQIAAASEGDEEPDDVREVYSASYGELSDAFGGLADAVNDAGDPPVDDGAELRTDAVAELNDLSDSYAELQTASDELDTSDRAAFADGLREMVGQLESLGESGDEALGNLQSGDLGDAMARQEGCQTPFPDDDGDSGADDGADEAETDDAAEDAEAAEDADADPADEADDADSDEDDENGGD